MERPCLSRRRALMLPASAVAVGGVAGCAPEGEGFGTSEPVRAEDGEIDLAEVPENASTLVNFGGQQPFALLVRGSGEDITAYRSEEHTSELQSRGHLVCRLLLEKKNNSKHTMLLWRHTTP